MPIECLTLDRAFRQIDYFHFAMATECSRKWAQSNRYAVALWLVHLSTVIHCDSHFAVSVIANSFCPVHLRCNLNFHMFHAVQCLVHNGSGMFAIAWSRRDTPVAVT